MFWLFVMLVIGIVVGRLSWRYSKHGTIRDQTDRRDAMGATVGYTLTLYERD